MQASYHIQITTQVIGPVVSRRALEVILAANLGQDRLHGQIGHPEFHFDDSRFEAGQAYLEVQRGLILTTLRRRSSPCGRPRPRRGAHPCSPAWQAFGRLTHAAQDFYAHSNYAALFVAQAASLRLPDPEAIDPLDPALLNSPQLRSGRTYLPWDALVYIPFLAPLVKRFIPRDGHAWMNLDDPGQGELFPYALAAALKRTVWEYEHLATTIAHSLGPQAVSRFNDFGG